MKKLKRKLYLLKCRIYVLMRHTIERVLHTLSKWGFVVEHKKSYSNIRDNGNVQTAPDLKSERFVFSVSYVISEVEFVNEYWFETKQGKRIFTVDENHHKENRVRYRADLKSFLCHFSHKHKQWVHSHAPKVVIPNKISNSYDYHTCGFSKCRYAFEIRLAKDSLSPTEEVISESCKVLSNSLMGRVTEINKILTGVENDGNLTSPSNCPLADNLVCKECGYPVFATKYGSYTFECINHGHREFHQIDKVDPKTYEAILRNCLTELEHFCECPQDNTFRC